MIRFLLLLPLLLLLPQDVSAEGSERYRWRVAEIASVEGVAPVQAAVHHTDLATDGINVLAAWDDVRRLGSRAGAEYVYAAVVRPDDTLATREAINLGPGSQPRAVRTGTGWVVIWRTQGRVLTRLLDDQGVPLGDDAIIIAEVPSHTAVTISVAARANRIAVVWSEGAPSPQFGNPAEVWGVVIDASGNIVLPKRRITAEEETVWVKDIVATDEGFLLAALDSDSAAFVQPLSYDLQPAGPRHIIRSGVPIPRMRLANGSTPVLVWQEGNQWEYLSGNVVRAARLRSSGELEGAIHTLSKADRVTELVLRPLNDGYLALWSIFTAANVQVPALRAAVLNADGSPGETHEIAIAAGESSPSMVQTADGRVAVLAQTRSGIPQLRRFSSDLQPLAPPITVSLAVAQPWNFHLLPHPLGFLAGWNESIDQVLRARIALVDHRGELSEEPLSIGSGAILAMTATDGGYLALLQEPGVWPREAMLVRFGSDGVPLADPVRIGACEGPTLAARGSEVMIICEGLGFKLITEDGTIRATSFPLYRPPGEIIATTAGWYAAWISSDGVEGVALTPDGTMIGAPRLLVDRGFLPSRLRLASRDGLIALVWHARSNVEPPNDYLGVVTLDLNGNPLTGTGAIPSIITEGWNYKNLLDAWVEGEIFHVSWIERDSVDDPWRSVRIRLDASGKLIDAPPHPPLFKLPFSSSTEASAWSGSRFAILGRDRASDWSWRVTLRIAEPVRQRPVRAPR
jgi:hypothetical protein